MTVWLPPAQTFMALMSRLQQALERGENIPVEGLEKIGRRAEQLQRRLEARAGEYLI